MNVYDFFADYDIKDYKSTFIKVLNMLLDKSLSIKLKVIILNLAIKRLNDLIDNLSNKFKMFVINYNKSAKTIDSDGGSSWGDIVLIEEGVIKQSLYDYYTKLFTDEHFSHSRKVYIITQHIDVLYLCVLDLKKQKHISDNSIKLLMLIIQTKLK